MAAWVFGAAGLGRGAGVAIAVVYGVMALVASLPGAVVLLLAHRAADRDVPRPPAEGHRMTERPYTLLSCGISIDGYLDGGTGDRLVLSNEADLDRVDDVRAGCDAILVGAATIRHDNPRLLVRQPARLERGRRGTPSYADQGDRHRAGPSWIRARRSSPPATARSSSTARPRGADRARAARAGRHRRRRRPARGRAPDERGPARPRRAPADGRGRRDVHTQFLTADLADELQLVVAPFFVGDSRARRFVGDGRFPWNPGRRARLAEVGRSATSCSCATRSRAVRA